MRRAGSKQLGENFKRCSFNLSHSSIVPLDLHFVRLVKLYALRVSSKQTKKIFRLEPKQTETRSVSVGFRFVSWNQKLKVFVCFSVSNLYRNNRNKQNCFETNRRKKNETTLNFMKILKYALYQTVSVGLLFVKVQLKYWNSLFRYRSKTTEINCFKTNQNKLKKTGKP